LVLASLDLRTDRKTILLSSHWTPSSLLRTHGAEVIRLLAGIPDTNLIVTGHNHLWYRRSVRNALGDTWYDLLHDTAASFPNVRLVRTGDVRPLLAASDLLIGDGSSLALEYSVLGRPIVQFCHESHDPGNGLLEDLLQRTVHRFNQLDELGPLVREQVARPTLGAAGARRALVDYSYDYLGCSTTRAADVIESLTENPDYASSLAGGHRRTPPGPAPGPVRGA
jgi:CDP-glycerol glycerophosphotransferase (TagB/SpsB family)